MGRARAQAAIPEPISAAEDLWYDLRRRASFVDGFAAVGNVDDAWPREGTLVWDARPGGRGRVVERVTRFVAREGQEADVEDDKIVGTQRVRFAPGVIALELDYALKEGTWLLDVLLVRRQVRAGIERTLRRFAIELAAERELAR